MHVGLCFRRDCKEKRRSVFKEFRRGLLTAVSFMWKSDYPVKGKLMYTAVAFGYTVTNLVLKAKGAVRG